MHFSCFPCLRPILACACCKLTFFLLSDPMYTILLVYMIIPSSSISNTHTVHVVTQPMHAPSTQHAHIIETPRRGGMGMITNSTVYPKMIMDQVTIALTKQAWNMHMVCIGNFLDMDQLLKGITQVWNQNINSAHIAFLECTPCMFEACIEHSWTVYLALRTGWRSRRRRCGECPTCGVCSLSGCRHTTLLTLRRKPDFRSSSTR